MASSPTTDNGAETDEDTVPGPDPTIGGFERILWDAIDTVPDPHIPLSLVEMGMIYDIRADGGTVEVEMTYPCLGCPAYDMLQEDVRQALQEVEGVSSVEINVTWDPPWSKAMLTEEARTTLRASGIDL